MSDDTQIHRRIMEGAQTFMSHWEGIVIVLMFSILLGFTLAFITTIYVPFTAVYPPQSAGAFNVTGNITTDAIDNNYTLHCQGSNILRRHETLDCTYTFATTSGLGELQNSSEPLLNVTWWPFTGDNVTRTIMQIESKNTTGNFSFHAPKRAERYMLNVQARNVPAIEHSASYTIQDSEEKTFRVLTDRQELSIFYRLLVLAFNIIVLTSIWFSAGEVAVELLERIDEKEESDEDTGY
ncbi:MAG: hypothetical protein SVU32_02710 [Candidatus Nanohaloarchaea archaeon]|nr:hypothetical protein [Candidatus Nanohaloarchaea archaeon]